MTDHIALTVPGPPTGQGRPRFTVKGKGARQWVDVYPDEVTRTGAGRILVAWTEAGKPRLDGPLTIGIIVVVARPKGHYRVNGELNATGLRSPVPIKKPDLDNVMKLVCDALNGKAYADDVQIVGASLRRRWCAPGEQERTIVVMRRHDGA